MAYHLRDEDRTAWLRTSWLACAVRQTVWGKDAATPRELLGWDSEEKNRKKISEFATFLKQLNAAEEAREKGAAS